MIEPLNDREVNIGQILCLNRHAYDSSPDYYLQRAPARGEKLDSWLSPLLDRLNLLQVPRLKLLDIGCGDGLIAEYLASKGYIVTGIDFSSAMCEVARQRRHVQILEEDFLECSLRDVFHCIIGIAFIHLFPPPWDVRVLSKMGALLASGGYIFLTTTIHSDSSQGFEPKRNPPSCPRYRKRHTDTSLRELFEKAQFDVVDWWEALDAVDSSKRWRNVVLAPKGRTRERSI